MLVNRRRVTRCSARSFDLVRAATVLCGAAVLLALTGAESARASNSIPIIAMLANDDEGFPTAYSFIDRLSPRGVVEMQVHGFDEFDSAVAEQCLTGASRSCANQIPVQFDADGTAQFQYLISNDFLLSVATSGGCRANTGRCTIVVRSIDGNVRSEIQTIFVDAAPPAGTIDVTPSKGLSLDGEMVTVSVRGFPPGAEVNAMLCAAPSAVGDRCGSADAAASISVSPDGTGATQLFIAPGTVGTEGARCFRSDQCGVSVFSDSVFTRAVVTPISFEGPSGARYSTGRLMLWLGVAALFIVIAAVVLRRTDWSAVGEAAAPEIDDAGYADLDAIIASLPPDVEDSTLKAPT